MVSPANVRIYILERLIFINDLKKLLRGEIYGYAYNNFCAQLLFMIPLG